MSWDEAFAERYDEWAAGMTADVGFYVGLAHRAEGPLVELAVGNGRVAIPVAQETGRRVIGIDSSPAMLARARTRAVEAGVDPVSRSPMTAASTCSSPAVGNLPVPPEPRGPRRGPGQRLKGRSGVSVWTFTGLAAFVKVTTSAWLPTTKP